MIYIVDALARKMDFPTTVDTLEFYHKKNSDVHNISKHEIYIETVGYQLAMEKFLKKTLRWILLVENQQAQNENDSSL